MGGTRIKARQVGGVRSRSETSGGSKGPDGKAKGSDATSTAERRRRTRSTVEPQSRMTSTAEPQSRMTSTAEQQDQATSTAEQQLRATSTAEHSHRAMSTDERRLRGDDVHLAGAWNSPRGGRAGAGGGRAGAGCCRNSPPLATDTRQRVMEDGHHFTHGFSSKRKQQQHKYMKISREVKGFLVRYILNSWGLLDGERLKRQAFGEKDESKPHKTILMVGETGVGKSTLINAMVNYMLGVESKDRIWFEVIETKEEQYESQTLAVTVYDLFTEHCPFSLTVIDTPGFRKTDEDLKVAESLLELLRSSERVDKVDAVCLVMSSSTVRLGERQRYMFNAVLSLFSNDVKKNFVVFITHAPTKPTNSIKAIKEAKIPCAQTDDEEPVYFRFNNSHCENFFVKSDPEEENDQLIQDFHAAWDLFSTSMGKFLSFIENNKPVSLKNTDSVLTHRKQLVEHITCLRKLIKAMRLEYEFEESYKEKVPIDPSTSSSKEATCCSVCKVNCHYPGCWWVRDLSWCGVMTKNYCTVCPEKCHYSVHVKEGKIYVTKTRKVKKTLEDLKKSYEKESGENKRWIRQLEEEISEQEKEITRLLEECDKCIHVLQEIALKTDALSTLQDLDFLCKEAKETQRKEIVQKLKELKKKAEGKSNQTRL
ncbi:hypothetical protein QTP70_025630 [Hemibagrus guttatus]|uniref:AIG1-type G domain-containing protein n=1 Tax=Hemibagrus guttatus TaxID=175788 RepID=A0AAE0VCA0_9TELE|nr:hypothetical protein QTP70_025630 [Hemibagrus guttatus]